MAHSIGPPGAYSLNVSDTGFSGASKIQFPTANIRPFPSSTPER